MIFGNRSVEESTVEGLAILLYNNFLKPNKDTYNVNMISHSFITCPIMILKFQNITQHLKMITLR